MKCVALWIAVAACTLRADPLWANEPHEHTADPSHEDTLTGEIVALWCHLIEGSFGTGLENSAKQVNCIYRGSPIAIKVGKTFYVVSTDDPTLKARLTNWAGRQVTVRGTVTQRDGHPFIAVSSVERAKKRFAPKGN